MSDAGLPLEAVVRSLADKQAITEVIHRYCRAIDRCDGDLLSNCFHADSTHDHGPYAGPSADFCKFALQLLAQVGTTQHQAGNILIDLRGDIAYAETYWVAYHRILADGPREGAGVLVSRGMDEDLFIGGRYIDRFERRSGEWRIAHRFGIHDWQRFEAADERDFKAMPADKRGQRNRSDRAYWRG